MRKGEKYQKKIDRKVLIKLLKADTSRKEIAEHFKCSRPAVQKAIKRYGLQPVKPSTIRKIKKGILQKMMFSDINLHASTAQGMIDELSGMISDNIAIKNSIRQKIKEAKSAHTVKEIIDQYYESQDKVVQRMRDYRELQRELIGIVELQKFINGVVEVYGTLPLQYRIRFQNELKKRNIAHLSIEQLVESDDRNVGIDREQSIPGDVDERNRKLPEATESSTNTSAQ